MRELHHAGGARSRELTVDLRQMASPADLERRIAAALDGPLPVPGVDVGTYGPMRRSPLWEFNAAFWRHAPGYMAAVGRAVRDSIGGSPDSDPARTQAHARRFCELLRGAVPVSGPAPTRALAFLDVGAADTGYAETMIRHLAAARTAPVDYLVADSSPGALRRAHERLGERRGPVSVRYLHFDLREPAPALAAYRQRILTAHLTNVLDNLLGEELVRIDGRHYLLHTCPYLSAASLERLAERHELHRGQLADDLHGIAARGADSSTAACSCWSSAARSPAAAPHCGRSILRRRT